MNKDALSPLAQQLLSPTPEIYRQLVVASPTPPAATRLLGNVAPEQLLSQAPKSPAYTKPLLAALWLWHDGLDECHRIVQNSPDAAATATYSFWHAIMHRREGDFSNSKYWYARASSHPVLAALGAQANPIIDRAPADKTLLRLTSNGWNPNAFVDFVEQIHTDEASPLHGVAVELQRMEWLALFDHCTRFA